MKASLPMSGRIILVALFALAVVALLTATFAMSSGATASAAAHDVRSSRSLGGSWSPLGGGANLDVNAIAVNGTDVYIGGAFTHAGGTLVNHVARWDGSTWHALGGGTNNSINAMGFIGNDLYVVGPFISAGGVPANRIAKWNGSSWSALGSGLNSTVFAMAISDNNIYVGGQFNNAGGVPANYVARWDGSTWHALGIGTNGFVYDIAAGGSDVYFTGQFNTAGGITTNSIAKWNGSSWSALGGGLGYTGEALAVNGSDLYVAGQFTSVSGIPANRIAKWNGSSWSALGSGLNHNAYEVAVLGGDVYVGGRFTIAGGANASRVARWDGSAWHDMAGGVNDVQNNASVYAMATVANGVYVGGTFTLAGGAPANRIAFYDTTGISTFTPVVATLTPTRTSTPIATPTLTRTPIPGNNPPTLTVPLNRPYRVGVEVGNYLALRFDASDDDAGDTVSLSVTGQPPGSSFPIPAPGNPIYTTFTWRPTEPNIGTYFMTVTATDSRGAQDTATIQIDVVPGCVPYFTDVSITDFFYGGVQYLFCDLVISGYVEPDLTFTYRPYNNTTRGQFSKMIVGAYDLPPHNPPTPTFIDVPTTDVFYPYVEAAYHAGVISGYADRTFRPYADITRGQLSKLVVEAANWPVDTSGGPHFTDVPPDSTFYGYIETAYNHGVITGYPCGGPDEPCDPQNRPYFRVGNPATRGQIAKILWQALGSPPPPR